ncbi:sacsin N-terminal ATP-binding-like domain-containing protein [Arthrobacter caoxuetaonis]|uniref:DEAD/DEAH box helicase family protein n=1 Tax=Arthrobacter caoxuetaonis TaxID=2886935 RepID=A0A9X1MD43_9MICC|nr:DEAD/DEAH box helicase family protein [Arthrobacter caoxuetaonis]MCC3297546.1 DEAD/DEAH box helicase family protein [Arthrobacter caoxuetaonis]USQ57924.1 DEAD/DEAH box helicase family protein [Arthrobacter caoxuetaonis]
MSTLTKGWEPDETLVREVKEQFASAITAYTAKPTLITEHANHEESIRTGGYASRTLLELVQNAADAMAGIDDTDALGRVEIVLDPESRTLYCANSGRPFSKSGLVAITHAHLSGKRGDEIGRFGLGFKSVLAVSSRPQVLSRSVSFEFNSKEANSALKQIGAATRSLPVLRTATLVDASATIAADPTASDLAEWATTIVRLPDITDLDRICKEMEKFASEFLLFVGAVREVRLSVLGDEGFTTSHVSRSLGDGRFKIERPDGTGDEWFVNEAMHAPSSVARREVGEAVSRSEIKVSVAIPLKPRRANSETGDLGNQIGQFWSYFPLQDKTSATAFFNAPWSVNDDRTTLLSNQYNREILATVAELFVELLPRLSTKEDPAAHLDYLPARGREAKYFGDEVLCALVPPLAVSALLVPDGTGELCNPAELRPLDFACDWKIPEEAHEGWIASPNTLNDVPHWRCYSSTQRISRLRQLFATSVDPTRYDDDDRGIKRALELMPKRGIQSWLREWAEGGDMRSSANALRVVLKNRQMDDADKVRVIPTSDGLKALCDRSLVFLEQADDLAIEGAIFISPEFLRLPDVEKILRSAGFRDLDPEAILAARLSQLTPEAGNEQQAKFWDAALGVSLREALRIVQANPTAQILVPTKDGEWHWPQQVLDLDSDIPAYSNVLLDRGRCLPVLAHKLGVAHRPVADFSLEDESFGQLYQEWVLEELNTKLTPGERPIEKIALYPRDSHSPGPFSPLFLFEQSGASNEVRESWTRQLLELGDASWDCEDLSTGASYRVKSPVRWAVEAVGLLRSSRGYRRIAELVAPSLVQYRDLLPLYEGPRSIVDILRLPADLKMVPKPVLRDALNVDLLPPQFDDGLLVEFLLDAASRAYPEGKPPRIPARVGRIIESCPSNTVFTAVNEEQRQYLATHQRPFLLATEAQAERLAQEVGCLSFEDSFSFSTRIDGEQDSEPLLDVFTGLRSFTAKTDLNSVMVARAESVAKWVTTKEGVVPQSLDSHRDGFKLVIRTGLDERATLRVVSESFDLGLNNSDIDRVLKDGIDHRLEMMRQEALAATTDVDRLEVYFGADDLREELPKGLWQGLVAQKLVNRDTSVAELFLSVYGKDSVSKVADLFRREGFPDVPTQWAGGAATISWLRKMGFGTEFAGQKNRRQDAEFVIPGATVLPDLHDYQARISTELANVILEVGDGGRRSKAMVELPTGAGKTRVATQTILQLFIDGELRGPILWIAQSQELCEQAVQTFSEVWRGLCTAQAVDLPLTVGRLWQDNEVHEPDTDLSVIVATDAKLDVIIGRAEYEWLSNAKAVFVDEGHVAGTSTRYTGIFSWLGVDGRKWERPLVGLSATPFKGTSAQATDQLAARFGRRKLVAFPENPYQELVARGVLARVEHRVLKGAEIELTGAEESEAKRTNRISNTVLDRVATNHARMAVLVDSIMGLELDWGRSVLVFTPNVLSAQVLAATLRFRGVEAASVSGQTGRQERRDLIKRFKDGDIQVLTNCDLLTQGFDAPGVTSLYIARPTFSPNAYIQMAGRGLRGPRNGGKEKCLIVDMADNFGNADINQLLGFREYEALWQEQQS